MHNATGQDSFPADQGNAHGQPEASVKDIMNSVLELNHKVFELVLSEEGVCCSVETADNS